MVLASLIEQYQEKYMAADRFEKTALSWEILARIQNDSGGRFIEKDEKTGAWRLVSQDVAREKVRILFHIYNTKYYMHRLPKHENIASQ